MRNLDYPLFPMLQMPIRWWAASNSPGGCYEAVKLTCACGITGHVKPLVLLLSLPELQYLPAFSFS